MATILHIDFDSFFASVAQQYNPTLRNKPVAITATNGRTAIIAASREAKARGIKSPSRTQDGFNICPELLIAKADFLLYFEVSKKFLRICSEYSPFIELFSIDELFMDITKTAHLFGGVDALMQILKKRIAEEIGIYITVSIGISYNKMLAKMASGLNKPNGICLITPENLLEVYGKAKLRDICGIGFRIEKRLNLLGIYTLLQLREVSVITLVGSFGNVEGHFLYQVGQGIDTSDLKLYTDKPDVKSVSRSYALPHNEYNRKIVEQNIYELCEEIALKLRRLKKKTRTIGLSLRGNDNFSAHKSVSEFIDNGYDIFTICKSFMDIWNMPMVRMISVWAGSLIESTATPQSLFEIDTKRDKLQKVIDGINDEFGNHTIRNGFLLYADKLTTVPNGFMADKFERTKLAEETVF